MRGTIYYNPNVGHITICEDNGFIVRVDFTIGDITPCAPSPLLKLAVAQFDEYFCGNRKIFDLPVKINGSQFQIKVWNELSKIEYGKTVAYKDIARRIGSPCACRAVGGAIHRNPVAIIIPCHRVIGSNGDLTGFAGGVNIKKYLLDLEKNAARQERADS